jgi:hypothetical protein
MIVTNYTPEHMKRLPLPAIAAFGARCAPHVAPKALLPDTYPDAHRYRNAVANAIELTEGFAKRSPCSAVESAVRDIESCQALAESDFVRESAMHAVVLAAHTAATAIRALDLRGVPLQSHALGAAKPNPFPHLAEVTADLCARDAFTAALTSADADGSVKGAVEDYKKLLSLDLGAYPQAGHPIDPSSNGPLGPLGTEESL